jgi:hypothetical protein
LQPLRSDVVLPGDTLARDGGGYTFAALLKPVDVGVATRSPEGNASGIDAARRKTELRLSVDVSSSRMRVAVLGRGWLWPETTELRARSDRYGHLAVWPGALAYRPLAPGALRAFLGERRFDVGPVTPAVVVPSDEGGKRLGLRTRKIEVTTRAAKATFEVARLPDLLDGGILICRMLLDLMNATPSSPVCGDSEFPVRAELRWIAHGTLTFDVTSMTKRTDLALSSMSVPPPDAVLADTPPPPSGVEVILAPAELAAFRFGAGEAQPGSHANETGLSVVNATDQLRMLYVDGVAVAWAGPFARGLVSGLHRGRYAVQWSTFLGDDFDRATTLTVPGTVQVGGGDAGK